MMNASILPNRDLLDPKFQSYKLSLKTGVIITTLENEGVDLKSLPQDNYSRLNIQLSSLHNCLFQDTFFPNHLFYVTATWKVKGLVIPSRKEAFTSGQTVFSIPQRLFNETAVVYNVSIKFLRNYALLSNGFNDIYLLETGDRLSEALTPWRVVFEHPLDLASNSGYLVDAVETKAGDDSLQIDCIILSVNKIGGRKSGAHIDWFTVSQNVTDWRMTRHRRLCCAAFPDYITFEGDASSLAVRSSQPLIPLHDTLNPDIKPPLNTSPPVKNQPEVRFTWTQSLPSMPEGDSTLLNVLVKLSDKYSISDPKTSLSIACKPCEVGDDCGGNLPFHRLELVIHSEEGDVQLCDARLFAPVRAGDPMWTYDRETNSIDITIVKSDAGTWPRLFADLDEERRLGVEYDDEALISATPDIKDEPMQSCFNVEQLEDVDMIREDDDEDAVMQRIDGKSLETVLRAEMIGHQKLYTAPTCVDSDGLSSPSHLLCTRYDVDGLLWAPQLHNTKQPWIHVATLQAFGYVLASKQNRRFVASPPINLAATPTSVAFVAVADISRHIYVYWQPAKNPLSELRHRRSGDKSSSGSSVVHVAWQQVISLPDDDEIIGFAAVVDPPYPACVVATQRALYLICLDEGDS